MGAMKNQRRRVMDETELDRLSSLPDPLLSHILGLVQDTKLAVKTCVLSKRWRNLWIHLSSLHLNSKYRKTPSFRNFVRQIMSKRKPYKIQTLRFYRCFHRETKNYKAEENFLNKVIDYVSKRGVEDELVTDNHTFFKGCCASLPELRSLKLIECCPFPCYNVSIYDRSLSLDHFKFPLLNRLHLESIPIDIKDHGPDLFSECANLEELVLIKCTVLKASTFTTISCPRLVRLTISSLCQYGKEIIISAPRLLEINVIGSISHRFSIEGCSNLRMVDIKGKKSLECITRDTSGKDIRFHSELRRFYQEVKNIFPKTRSLVLECLGWKWIFMKDKNSASIEIYDNSVDHSVATLTWKMDVDSSDNCLEYDWNEVDFVGIFGKLGFVTCPGIIRAMSHSYVKLNASLKGMLGDSFDDEIKKNLYRTHIMNELATIEADFRKIMFHGGSDSKNWKCNVTRTWNKEIMWEMQWPN